MLYKAVIALLRAKEAEDLWLMQKSPGMEFLPIAVLRVKQKP
jgi:hypothetical protein